MTFSTAVRVVSAILIMAAQTVAAQAQGARASWLEAPKPVSWNTPGALIPKAPTVQAAADPRCKQGARTPQLDEDTLLHEQGWDLVGAYQGGWQTLVIRGTAGYDGMCRPQQFNDFVFVRGAFAGTLSPNAMDSRTDGALSRVTLRSAGQLSADYQRYGTDDPLCCPSSTTTVVFAVSSDPAAVQPVSASSTKRGASSASIGLAGTSWQLVDFQGGDGTTLTPDDRAKYTIDFGIGGQVSARIDCNRGRGTWTTSDANGIRFGPLALTRAKCQAGALHDQIVKQWANIRSYVIRDGHLFLSLMADGGIYEFEPRTGAAK